MSPEIRPGRSGPSDLSLRLPQVAPEKVVGLLDLLALISFGQSTKLAHLADTVAYDSDVLLGLLETLEVLGLVELAEASVRLSRMGRRYARSSHHERKLIVRDQVAKRIPLAAYVRDLLQQATDRNVTLSDIRTYVAEHASAPEAASVLPQVLTLGRHAGLFLVDEASGIIKLSDASRQP